MYATFLVRGGKVEAMTEPQWNFEKAKDTYYNTLKRCGAYNADLICAMLSIKVEDNMMDDVTVQIKDCVNTRKDEILHVTFSKFNYMQVPEEEEI